MKFAIPLLIAVPLGVGGCDQFRPREIRECEQSLLAKLKAPSTYRLINSHSTYMKEESPPQVWVSIVYDAENTFGAPIRDTEICQYPADAGGSVDWVKVDRAREAEVDALMRDYGKKDNHAEVSAPKPAAAPSRTVGGTDAGLISPEMDSANEQQIAAAATDHPRTTTPNSPSADKDVCWEDYCPCDSSDPDYGGADYAACKELRSGRADDQMMDAAAELREARRQIRESGY